jgi:hypothetical protein
MSMGRFIHPWIKVRTESLALVVLQHILLHASHIHNKDINILV